MKPAYITFEQAKILKEKKFDVRVKSFYDVIGELNTIENDEMNTKGFANRHLPKGECSAPEQHIVIEWLRIKHNIHIWVNPIAVGDYKYTILSNEWLRFETEKFGYNSPQEAYSAAFDYVLKNNL